MQISGYVKEIYEGTTKTGRSAGKPFWSITLDTDAKLTCFNLDFIKDVEEGKEYTFTYEKSGDYINLTAPSVPVVQQQTESQPLKYVGSSYIEETTSPDSTTVPLVDEPVEMPPRVFGTASNKDEAIRKAVALKAAVEYVASVLGGTGTTKDVISYAREFEAYLA